jgi:hypothetical protein
MDEKYLTEQFIKYLEKNTEVSTALLEVSRGMQENLKSLNDSFVLHNQKSDNMCQEVSDIKNTLIKWLRTAIIALIIAVGGASIIKFILDSKLF